MEHDGRYALKRDPQFSNRRLRGELQIGIDLYRRFPTVLHADIREPVRRGFSDHHGSNSVQVHFDISETEGSRKLVFSMAADLFHFCANAVLVGDDSRQVADYGWLRCR